MNQNEYERRDRLVVEVVGDVLALSGDPAAVNAEKQTDDSLDHFTT